MTETTEQTNALIGAFQSENYRRTDRLFALIMPVQWALSIGVALVVSPRTWSGAMSETHVHVYAAVFLGGLVTAIPVLLAWLRPGRAATRHAVAAGQLMMSALLIHLSGGRIETHFHIFVSLAFLGFYQDWRVLITGAAVAALDHLIRGLYWPESLFGVLMAGPWRIVEHAVWVVLEVAGLARACLNAERDMERRAIQQVDLEAGRAELTRIMDALRAEKEAVDRRIGEAVADSDARRTYLAESVDRMVETMARFAAGDLTVRLKAEHDDEIGRLFDGFNSAVDDMERMMHVIRQAVLHTNESASAINDTTRTLQAGAGRQTAEAADVAAAVEEMASTTAGNARNATDTAEITQQTGRLATQGGDVVRQTVDKMQQIARVVQDSSAVVERLGGASKEIEQIISVIDEIASQTNLLALNAAIEAARAGEQGKGFAVVADEVRKLAERTTQATDQITSMVRGIQGETQTAVQAMQAGTGHVDEGLMLTREAGAALEAVVENMRTTVDMVTQIAAASEEQSKTSLEITERVEAIATVTQDAEGSVQDITDVAAVIKDLADTLNGLVDRFTVREGVGRADNPAPLRRAAEYLASRRAHTGPTVHA